MSHVYVLQLVSQSCSDSNARTRSPVVDAFKFLIRHSKNELLAACDALGLEVSGSEQDLFGRILAAARDVASLTMQHSKTELMNACDALGLAHQGSKSELGALLHGYLRPAY